MLRTKIELERLRVWDEDHNLRELPENRFKKADLWPEMQIRTIWLIPTGWGVTLETTDVKVQEIKIECPF